MSVVLSHIRVKQYKWCCWCVLYSAAPGVQCQLSLLSWAMRKTATVIGNTFVEHNIYLIRLYTTLLVVLVVGIRSSTYTDNYLMWSVYTNECSGHT